MKKEYIITHASLIYKTPTKLMEDHTISKKIKVQALEYWRLDIIQLLIADEENMSSERNFGHLLSQISNYLIELNS